MGTTWLRVGGVPATEIAAHTPPQWEDLANGGSGAARWAFALTAKSQHPALKVGSLVEVMVGMMPVYTGVLSEPDRSTWECHAVGLSSSLRGYLALDGGGASTRSLSTAIAQALARGWMGRNPLGISGTAAGDATGNPVTVGALLDDYAVQTGLRWGTNGRGELFMRPDPVGPSLMTSPDVAVFAPTTENAPRTLAGRYFDGAINVTVLAGSGLPEETRDLTDRGILSHPAAVAILEGELERQKASEGWSNSVTLHREQLLTIGGTPANLAANHGGKILHAHGFTSNASGASLGQSVLIGKTIYTADEEWITIEPSGKAPRTATEVWAKTAAAAPKGYARR